MQAHHPSIEAANLQASGLFGAALLDIARLQRQFLKPASNVKGDMAAEQPLTFTCRSATPKHVLHGCPCIRGWRKAHGPLQGTYSPQDREEAALGPTRVQHQ